ncbi:MAG: phosphonate C-P lyase system protein PhnH [Pseudomonadota bacterium]
MDAASLSGGFADPPIDAAAAFRAAMTAMARPGAIQTAQGGTAPAPVSAAAATLLLTVADAETPVHLAGACDTPAIRDWLTFHTGAPLVDARHAMFALGDWASLQPLDRFPVGVPEYPDRSATLIVEMEALSASGARLTGPGIETAAALSLPEVAAFQANRVLFPLGLDFYFCAGERLAALPRTTIVEAA